MEAWKRNMDITKILIKLTDNLQKIYKNVDKIVNEQDGNTKTNEEDLILLVESIEELKIVINKKKEQLKCPLFEGIVNNIKEVAEKLNNHVKWVRLFFNNYSFPTSNSYKLNHNLADTGNYGGMKPFQIESKTSLKVEESKVGQIMNPMMGIKQEESKPYINHFGKNMAGIDQENLFNNDDHFQSNRDNSPFNNFFDDAHEQPKEVIDGSSRTQNIQFLKNLWKYKKSEVEKSNVNGILALISQSKVLIKEGKISGMGQDQEMADVQEEEK